MYASECLRLYNVVRARYRIDYKELINFLINTSTTSVLSIISRRKLRGDKLTCVYFNCLLGRWSRGSGRACRIQFARVPDPEEIKIPSENYPFSRGYIIHGKRGETIPRNDISRNGRSYTYIYIRSSCLILILLLQGPARMVTIFEYVFPFATFETTNFL